MSVGVVKYYHFYLHCLEGLMYIYWAILSWSTLTTVASEGLNPFTFGCYCIVDLILNG